MSGKIICPNCGSTKSLPYLTNTPHAKHLKPLPRVCKECKKKFKPIQELSND